MADFYGVLNVQKGATDSDLKRAYRKLARRWHPDKNPGDPEANNKFQEVSRAYEVLIDREKRAIYDQYGEDGLVNGIPGEDDSGGFPATVNAHETFERFFGTANPFADFGFGDSMPFASSMSKSGPEQTPAVTSDLACTLEELFNGCTKRLSVERQRLGATGGNLVADEKVLSIHIKPGWKKGTKITFPQQGDEAPGKLPADLIFVVAEQPHDAFVREGNNLVHTAKVTLLQALTDCVVNVPTLDGRTLPIPCHDVLSPGYSLTIPGEGMPISGSEGERGDLILKFDIEFPAQGALTAEKKKKLAEVLG